MQPSFLTKHLSHQSLATVICYYMVYLSTLSNSCNVCRTQLLVLLLFRPSSLIFHPFLRIFTGSRLIFGLNLKYLSLLRRLSIDWLLLMFKIFLQSYLPTQDLRSSKKNLLTVPAFNINSNLLWPSCFFCCCATSLEQSSSAYWGCWIPGHF